MRAPPSTAHRLPPTSVHQGSISHKQACSLDEMEEEGLLNSQSECERGWKGQHSPTDLLRRRRDRRLHLPLRMDDVSDSRPSARFLGGKVAGHFRPLTLCGRLGIYSDDAVYPGVFVS